MNTVEEAQNKRNKQEIANMKWKEETQLKNLLLKEKLFEIYCQSIEEQKSEFECETSLILESLHECWAMWLEEKALHIEGAKPFEAGFLQRQLKDYVKAIIQKVKSGESPIDNFYHLTKLGSNSIQSNLDKSLSLFSSAISLDEDFAMIAYYKRAQCHLEKRKPNNYLDLALADLNKVNEKLSISKNEVLNTKMFVNMSGKSPGSNEEDFCGYITAKCQVLQLLEDNVSEGLKECQRVKDQKKKAKVNNKSLFLADNTKFQDTVIEQFSEMGLDTLFAVKEKWTLCWSAVVALGIGVLEVAGGVLLMATNFGANFGSILIIEGVSDCFAAVKGIISASWDWAAWGISKPISIATSIVCLGVTALCKPGGLKALKNAIKHPLKTAKACWNAAKKGLSQAEAALKNIHTVLAREVSRQGCSQALKSQVKNAVVCVVKEVATQGIMLGVEKLTELGSDGLKNVLGSAIKPAIVKALNFQSGSIFEEVSLLYNLQVANADEDWKQHEEKKLLSSIAQSAQIVFAEFTSSSQWEERLKSFFGTVLTTVVKNPNVNIKVRSVLTLIQQAGKVYTIAEAISTITIVTMEYQSKLASYLKKNRTSTDDIQMDLEKLPQTFLEELKATIAELLYDVFASIIHQKMANLAVAKYTAGINKFIRNSKYLDQSRNIESLLKGGQAFNIAYGKSSVHDTTSREAVDYHRQEILNEDKPGGLLDIRVLSDEHDCKVELYVEDEDGNLKPLRGVGVGSKKVVKILYTEPGAGSDQGHYDTIIDGKVVSVDGQKNNCLFKAFAKGLNPDSQNLDQDARDLRQNVSDKLQSDPQGYAKIADQYETLTMFDPRLMAIGGERPKKHDHDHQMESSEYERVKIFEIGTYGELKNDTADGTNFHIDHMPAVSCVINAKDSELRTALLGENGLKNRGRDMPACRVPAEYHKFFLSTGNSNESKKYRQMVTRAISDNKVEDMAKFTLIGSTSEHDQRFFNAGNKKRAAGRPQKYIENNQDRFRRKQKEAFCNYPGIL